MKTFADIDYETGGDYIKLLTTIAQLSGLYSESAVPFLNYRIAENIFCKSFTANNLSRSDTAFDANYNSLGVGIKTFTINKNESTEKIAEFNSLSRTLMDYKGKDLAYKLAEFRNERIDAACRIYDINNSIYHIVARREKELVIFDTDYDKIDIDKISGVKEKDTSLEFRDDKNIYRYNFSKSTLFRKFHIPTSAYCVEIEILDNPFDKILDWLEGKDFKKSEDLKTVGKDYVILPLYGIKNKQKYVFEKSGLNQWNAGGRKRNSGEVYIPIPKIIHHKYPDFFPPRDREFKLIVPTGNIFVAKICQDDSKALMTNPNKQLSDWLLRKILKLEEGELATIEKLEILGFDSVIVEKLSENEFKIDIRKTDAYKKFLIH